MITVSCIDSGTGSVGVFGASRFAEDVFDFGKLFQNQSETCSTRLASATEMPGIVVAM